MPTYEFRCPQGHEFEKFYRTISGAEAQAACPECGQPAERMLSATGFAFKGSGFYLTDYGKNAHREKGGASAPAASGEGGGDSTKPETAAAKGDSAKGDAAASTSGPAADSKSTSAKPAEAKPAPAPAKKSDGE
jgi:putative FmdB family regulatory protein